MAEYNKVQPDLSFVKNVMDAGGDTVKSCYQCATCSVVCPLSTPESPFPRKEMLWTQWGLADKVAGDVDVWLCHQCGDCTAYCPRDARPGDVLGAIRTSAIRYYAQPKALADMLSRPGGVIGAIIAAAVLVLVVAGIWSQVTGEGFPFPEGDVVYHKFLSVIPIDAIFLTIVAFVLRRLVDLIKRHKIRLALLRQYPRYRRCQRRLAMIYMTYRPYIHMRLSTLKLLLAHDSISTPE